MAAVGVPLVMTISCGTTTDTGAPDWTEFNEETVALALETVAAAGDLYAGGYHTTGVDAACAATVEYLASQEGVLRAGIAPDSSVWAHFRNDFSATILEETFSRTPEAGHVLPSPGERQGGGEAVGSTLVVTPCLWDVPYSNPGRITAYLDTCMGWSFEPAVMTDAEVSVTTLHQVLETGIGTLFWGARNTGACGHRRLCVCVRTDDRRELFRCRGLGWETR